MRVRGRPESFLEEASGAGGAEARPAHWLWWGMEMVFWRLQDMSS